jgi:type IV secretory pathway VirB2 component (pilin)
MFSKIKETLEGCFVTFLAIICAVMVGLMNYTYSAEDDY